MGAPCTPRELLLLGFLLPVTTNQRCTQKFPFPSVAAEQQQKPTFICSLFFLPATSPGLGAPPSANQGLIRLITCQAPRQDTLMGMRRSCCSEPQIQPWLLCSITSTHGLSPVLGLKGTNRPSVQKRDSRGSIVFFFGFVLILLFSFLERRHSGALKNSPCVPQQWGFAVPVQTTRLVLNFK